MPRRGLTPLSPLGYDARLRPVAPSAREIESGPSLGSPAIGGARPELSDRALALGELLSTIPAFRELLDAVAVDAIRHWGVGGGGGAGLDVASSPELGIAPDDLLSIYWSLGGNTGTSGPDPWAPGDAPETDDYRDWSFYNDQRFVVPAPRGGPGDMDMRRFDSPQSPADTQARQWGGTTQAGGQRLPAQSPQTGQSPNDRNARAVPDRNPVNASVGQGGTSRQVEPPKDPPAPQQPAEGQAPVGQGERSPRDVGPEGGGPGYAALRRLLGGSFRHPVETWGAGAAPVGPRVRPGRDESGPPAQPDQRRWRVPLNDAPVKAIRGPGALVNQLRVRRQFGTLGPGARPPRPDGTAGEE